jgi:predicted metal-dependent hydrolase
MPSKSFEIVDVGKITVFKKRSNKNIRISIAPNNVVKVSIPIWSPYIVGVNFAKNNRLWIKEKSSAKIAILEDGKTIGRDHFIKVTIKSSGYPTVRIRDQILEVTLSDVSQISDTEIQTKIIKCTKKILKTESEMYIIPRIIELSEKYKLNFEQIKFKELKRRWGSCDSNKIITINYYLIQLPWEIIDYVLLHELVHTEHMSHDQHFWDKLYLLNPSAKSLRKDIKKFNPVII